MTKTRIDKHTQARRDKQQQERALARLRAKGKLQEAHERWQARIVGEVTMTVLSCLEVNGADLTDEFVRGDMVEAITDTLDHLRAETPDVEKSQKTDEQEDD